MPENTLCEGCIARDKKIEQLQKKIDKLVRKIDKASKCIAEMAKSLAGLKGEFENLLSKGGGVPRGSWSYAKGGKAVADKAIQMLNAVAAALRG